MRVDKKREYIDEAKDQIENGDCGVLVRQIFSGWRVWLEAAKSI